MYATLRAAGVRKVIFYCGSSRGRGSRAAGWLADHIAAQEKEDEKENAAGGERSKMQSLALAGGIKEWAAAGDEYVAWMDGYDAAVWETRKETSR